MLDTLNNTYLLKSLNHVVNNLNPRFVYIDFEISEGDTFEKILNKLIKIKYVIFCLWQ